jgi:hypothetical protein
MKTENLGSRVANLCKEYNIKGKAAIKTMDQSEVYRNDYASRYGRPTTIAEQTKLDDYVITQLHNYVVKEYGVEE